MFTHLCLYKSTDSRTSYLNSRIGKIAPNFIAAQAVNTPQFAYFGVFTPIFFYFLAAKALSGKSLNKPSTPSL
jgi:hypothetical protein